MIDTLDQLDAFGELDGPRYSPEVRAQLAVVSGATIDRMLAPSKGAMAIMSVSGAKAGSMLRSSIPIRRAGDTGEGRGGFAEVDTGAHGGSIWVGESAHTVDLTDVVTGWTEPMAIKNKAHVWIVAALAEITARMPFDLLGMDFDNGSQFINYALIGWAADRKIHLTRSRPDTSNDDAHIEQKNGDLVRRNVPGRLRDQHRREAPVSCASPPRVQGPGARLGATVVHSVTHLGDCEQQPGCRPLRMPIA